jgi:hypothetical protein
MSRYRAVAKFRIHDGKVEMLADPTPEMRTALARLPMTLYGRLQGLD